MGDVGDVLLGELAHRPHALEHARPDVLGRLEVERRGHCVVGVGRELGREALHDADEVAEAAHRHVADVVAAEADHGLRVVRPRAPDDGRRRLLDVGDAHPLDVLAVQRLRHAPVHLADVDDAARRDEQHAGHGGAVGRDALDDAVEDDRRVGERRVCSAAQRNDEALMFRLWSEVIAVAAVDVVDGVVAIVVVV